MNRAFKVTYVDLTKSNKQKRMNLVIRAGNVKEAREQFTQKCSTHDPKLPYKALQIDEVPAELDPTSLDKLVSVHKSTHKVRPQDLEAARRSTAGFRQYVAAHPVAAE